MDRTLSDVPADAYWSWGLYDSLIVVIPSLDIVVARAGQSWKREKGDDHYEVLKPFLTPIVQAVQSRSARVSDPAVATTEGLNMRKRPTVNPRGTVGRPATALLAACPTRRWFREGVSNCPHHRRFSLSESATTADGPRRETKESTSSPPSTDMRDR